MKEQLIKAMQRNQFANMMYVSKSDIVTKRRIEIIKIVGDSFQVFCFTRHANCTFTINNVLAVVLILHKEREVI